MTLYCADATASGSSHQPHQNPSTSSSSIPELATGRVSVEMCSIILLCLKAYVGALNSSQGIGTGLVVGAPLQPAPAQSVLGKEVRGMCVGSLLKEGKTKIILGEYLRGKNVIGKEPR